LVRKESFLAFQNNKTDEPPALIQQAGFMTEKFRILVRAQHQASRCLEGGLTPIF